MKKKTFYRLALSALCMLSMMACGNKKFTIEGTIEGATDSLLCLHHMSLNGPVLLDSVRLGADGQFAFTGDAPGCPDFYVLRIADQVINLSIDSTETVTVTARYPGMAANYEVAGSDDCAKIKELAKKQMELQNCVMALQQDRQMNREQALDSLQHLLNVYKKDVTMNYIFSDPSTAYAYFALFQTLGPWSIFDRYDRDDQKVFGAVATSWDTFYPEAERTKNLRSITLKSMNDTRLADARQQQMLDGNVEVIESGVIDLVLPDKDGQLRTLTELKGKVVLLDFHLFAHPESATRILSMRELYNKYHAQGLEIYQVSIDDDLHLWKQATDALPWICVNDPTGESCKTYNVQAVPEFFLIDRHNTLQKRSSQMGDVEAEIKALL